MATTFDDLEINPTMMREGNEDALKDYDNTQLKALYKTIAKNDLKLDLRNILSLDDNDTDNSTLDDIADKYEDRLVQALMYRQLYYYYFKNNDGEGSQNNDRMREYRKSYESARSYFSTFKITGKVIDKCNIVSTVRG